MFKKLDILVFKSFIGPFIITFFIAIFVLMMQILWKYIDDLVGKGLDFTTILQFIWYASASLLVLAIPIAILISTIMTFGNLGESFELVAIKSSGISLLRFMRPIMIFTTLLCGVTFLFANYVIPYTQLKFYTLYNDIFFQKPAFDIKPGIFYTQIPNYTIRVEHKDPDGKSISNVVIFEQGNVLMDNSIYAEKGEMKVSQDKRFLEFNLFNGTRYQERGLPGDSTTEFIRLGFKEFKKLFDLSAFQRSATNDSIFKSNAQMLSARQLGKNIDSLNRMDDTFRLRYAKSIDALFANNLYADSLVPVKNVSSFNKDFVADSAKFLVKERAITMANEIKNNFVYSTTDSKERAEKIKDSKIEFHKKFAFSFACLILFFIGAPLGSIIRKGGMGMPLVVAIIFFLIFHLLNVFGLKFAKQGVFPPVLGMWFAIIVLAPVGAWLTYKAMHDSQLFNKEFLSKKIQSLVGFFKRKNKLRETEV